MYFAVILDIALNIKAYHSCKFSNMARLLLKLVVAVAWVVILPVCYLHSWENPSGILKMIKDWLRQTDKIPSLYISAVIIYLLPNVLGAVLFLLPSLRTVVEKSNWKIFQFLLWWSQVSVLILLLYFLKILFPIKCNLSVNANICQGRVHLYAGSC